MSKWCFNYDSGEYEYIDKDGFSICIIGMTANIAEMKKNKAVLMKMMIGRMFCFL